jgi:DMSO/TMAO reductase YedYZ molybdopterin-dependent catalytic subunit
MPISNHRDNNNNSNGLRVPPGQHLTNGFPVLSYGETPSISLDQWKLKIYGRVEKEVVLNWQEFTALPKIQVTADFHCVTTWSRLDNLWEGVATGEILKLVKVKPESKFVLIHCYGGYTTNLPLEDFLKPPALLAVQWEGKPLEPDHGGPCRLVIPHLYAWKSAKWVNGIELLSQNQRGFWERNGYHNYGDPWKEERYSSQEED